MVGPGSVGGAEQVRLQIDKGLVRRGHRSLVVARSESQIAGTLFPTLAVDGPIANETWFAAHDSVRKAISDALASYPVDLVHMHEIHFNFLPPDDVPTLITLHMPTTGYSPRITTQFAAQYILPLRLPLAALLCSPVVNV